MQQELEKDSSELVPDKEYLEIVACTFQVYDKVFSVEIEKVLKVLENPEIVPIPLAPEYVVGIMSLQGEPVPVVDLSILYNLKGTSATERFIVVVETVNGPLGLLSTGKPDLVYEHSAEVLDVDEISIQYRVKKRDYETGKRDT